MIGNEQEVKRGTPSAVIVKGTSWEVPYPFPNFQMKHCSFMFAKIRNSLVKTKRFYPFVPMVADSV